MHWMSSEIIIVLDVHFWQDNKVAKSTDGVQQCVNVHIK